MLGGVVEPKEGAGEEKQGQTGGWDDDDDAWSDEIDENADSATEIVKTEEDPISGKAIPAPQKGPSQQKSTTKNQGLQENASKPPKQHLKPPKGGFFINKKPLFGGPGSVKRKKSINFSSKKKAEEEDKDAQIDMDMFFGGAKGINF